MWLHEPTAVKVKNLLLGGTKQKPIVKLIDFGFAQPTGKRITDRFSGTRGYSY